MILEYLGVAVGFASILVTLWVFYADVRRKLSYLINQASETLTYAQAKALTNLYLTSTERAFTSAIQDYLMRDFADHLEANDIAGAKRRVEKAADEVLGSMRDSVSSFRVPRSVTESESFKEFLDKLSPVHSGLIAETKKGISAALEAVFDNPEEANMRRVGNLLSKGVEDASRASRELYTRELERRYKWVA